MDARSESPAVILYDAAGNAVGVVQDGAVNRLLVESKAPNVLSENNSTVAIPTIATPFVGTADDILGFSELTITLTTASNTPHTGTLYFEFSLDGVTWDVSVPISYDSTDGFVPFPLRVILPFFRLRYIPAADNLTSFRLTLLLHSTSAKHLTRLLSQPMRTNEPIEAVRAVLTGQSDGGFLNVPTDTLGRLAVTDGSEFARLLNHRVENNEEIRLDMEATATDHYVGVAPDNTPEDQPLWRIIRIYLSVEKEQERMRFRQGVRWDQRTTGW